METGEILLGITNYIGHFNQYHIVYTLCFTGYYVDDNAHVPMVWLFQQVGGTALELHQVSAS